MVLPLILLFVATLAAAVVAYGVHPAWAQYSHGLELILLTRRLQWPIVAVSILAAVALLALIVAGKRRAWWLIGLGPILALFVHRFATDPQRALQITDEPQWLAADRTAALDDGEWVVGLVFDGDAYAYPYKALYASPVVLQSHREQRLMVIWSAFANRVLAVTVDRALKAREMEIVSMPANALLVYDGRRGQFINGVTGLTPQGARPAGVEREVRAVKTTWGRWRTAHPQTQVMAMPPTTLRELPAGPVMPYFPMTPGRSTLTPGTRVALVGTTRPSAVLDEAIPPDRPCNLVADGVPLVFVREPGTGAVRAFERTLAGDVTAEFRAASGDAKHADVTMADAGTGSLWSSDGRAVAGPAAGQRLLPFAKIDDGVYGDVLQAWYPDLKLVAPLPPPAKKQAVPTTPGTAKGKAAARRTRRRATVPVPQ